MMSCRHSTELMSQKIDRPLTLKERLWLKGHLLMCFRCRRCDQQLDFIHQACQKRKEGGDAS